MRRFAGVASTLFACVVGCGSDEVFTDAGVGPDARSIDADTTEPDAEPPQTVQVTTYAYCCNDAPGTPEAGVTVIVVAPDGSAGDSGVTDASGELTLEDVVPGSSVTAIYELTTPFVQTRMTTTVAVKPGDHLVYGEHYYALPAAGVTGTMTVSFPALGAATSFGARSRCGNATSVGPGSTSITVNLSPNCQYPTSDILLFASDDNGPIAAGFLDDQAFTSGATSTLAAWTTVTPDNYTVTVTGLPDDAYGLGMRGNAYLGELGDLGVDTLTGTSANMGSITTTIPPFGERTWSSADLLLPGEVGDVVTYRAGAVGAASSALTSPTVPRVGTLTVGAAFQAVTWLQGPGTYDAGYATMWWNANESFYEDQWDVIFPAGVTTFRWDTVPAALADYVPQTDDGIAADLMLVDLASADSYDELRAIPAWELDCPRCAVQEGDQTGAEVAFDYGGGEGPMGRYLKPRRPVGGATHTTQR